MIRYCPVNAFDSTTIDLCLSLFPWASFRRRKGAVKRHILIDLRGHIPCLIRVTHGKVHDVKVLDHLRRVRYTDPDRVNPSYDGFHVVRVSARGRRLAPVSLPDRVLWASKNDCQIKKGYEKGIQVRSPPKEIQYKRLN